MAAHAEHAAQVVLAKHKNIPKKFVALKVVYLRSPDMLQEPEHLAIMKRYMSPYNLLPAGVTQAAQTIPYQHAASIASCNVPAVVHAFAQNQPVRLHGAAMQGSLLPEEAAASQHCAV